MYRWASSTRAVEVREVRDNITSNGTMTLTAAKSIDRV